MFWLAISVIPVGSESIDNQIQTDFQVLGSLLRVLQYHILSILREWTSGRISDFASNSARDVESLQQVL